MILLSLYLAVYPGLATLGTWWMTHRFALSPTASLFMLAACWIVTEFLRATLFTGFAWNPLGVILLPTGAAISATVIGTYGLGALVILAAGALMFAVHGQARLGGVIAAPIVLLALIGWITPAPLTPAGAPRVRVVQPNIGQEEKYSVEAEYRARHPASSSGPKPPYPPISTWNPTGVRGSQACWDRAICS